MLVSKHIFLGAAFSLIIGWALQLGNLQIWIIFLASFLIDFDHYLIFCWRTGNWNLRNAYNSHLVVGKPTLVIFHTIEFYLLVLGLALIWNWFFLVLLGMIFHCICDYIWMKIAKEERVFCLIRYLKLRKKNPERYF